MVILSIWIELIDSVAMLYSSTVTDGKYLLRSKVMKFEVYKSLIHKVPNLG